MLTQEQRAAALSEVGDMFRDLNAMRDRIAEIQCREPHMKFDEHDVEIVGLRLALKAFLDLYWIVDGPSRLTVEPSYQALAALDRAKKLLHGKSLTPITVGATRS